MPDQVSNSYPAAGPAPTGPAARPGGTSHSGQSSRKQNQRPNRKKRGWKRWRSLETWAVVAVVLLVASYVGVLELSRPHVSGERLRYDELVLLLDSGRVTETNVLAQDAFVTGRYTDQDGASHEFNAPLLSSMQTDIAASLVAKQIPVTIDQQVTKRVLNLASILIPGLILVILFVYMIMSHKRGTGLFSVKSGAQQVESEQVPFTFADVAGQDAAVTELREIQDFLAHPERFTAMGATVPRGILLYGPPGSGKTLMAKALAGEAGAQFFSISGSDFVEVFVGVGASRVRHLFKEAREHAPAVIFIDELDSVGRARSSGSTPGSGEHEQALNQILAEMDGFSTQEGVVVLAATNRPDILDQALLRPGRFDRHVGLERPDESARLAILTLHARNKTFDAMVDLGAIARRAIGLTGADLANVLNEGALMAVRAGNPAITQADLTQAVQRILGSPERQRRLALRERSIGTRFSSEERVTFADVAGVDEVVAELAELRDYLAHPDRFTRLGARAPRGVLMSGPPGCGKTLLARAVAGEANAAFISVAGSEFVQMYAGQGAARVRDLFSEARALAPAIVFFDEVDAVGASRTGGGSGGHGERDQTLNQILVELDGFATDDAVIVMAATNRPDMLDSALVRPGRFDRHVVVSPPDRRGRLAILKLHAARKPLAADVDLEKAAGLTRGMSGAELANVLNEAALLAARRGLDEIPMALVEEGIDRAVIGVTAGNRIDSEAELKAVAFHEAGHAVVALACPGANKPHKLTIVPRGSTGGHCQYAGEHDTLLWTRSVLLNQIAATLGGRVAEELVFGEPSTAASGDLRNATDLATRMVRDWAMTSATGSAVYPGTSSGAADPSPHTADLLDTEVRRLIGEAHETARMALVEHRPALDRVAKALLATETVTAAELDILFTPPIEVGPRGKVRNRPGFSTVATDRRSGA